MTEEKKDIVEEVKEKVEEELKGKTVVLPKSDSKPPGVPFLNLTRFRFIDISNELFRKYLYANGASIMIEYPLKLSVSKDNTHRVFDASGLSYYIPPNWISIVSKAKPGAPNFIM